MIVVGVDGSRAGVEAAAWAAREAALRHAPLRIVHAIPDWACRTAGKGPYAEVAEWMRSGAEQVLAGAAERAEAEAPHVETATAILPGDPRSALIAEAAGAALLVVGNHGLGGFRGLLVGSVAHGVAGHAPCDVVVVRTAPGEPGGEVVAGVDGSPAGGRSLEFAFAEAALRHAPLRAVHAWNPFEGPLPGGPRDEEGEARLLREALEGPRARHPDVAVTEEVVRGHPVDALLRASEGADLLVVGSRGHGAFAGLVLGAVTQPLLHHATCPLAVVRPAAPDTPEAEDR
ncbi:universal stress protein [Microbispora corallina]|uniref:Universal stress protein n=1 Tax=Microbispora corallina TaxID=83302 RepID=A0ABQ4G487_9ACTN|nr:universal stress protein [Microbispora corallina]GIH41857.1 universal stress protein [Microbispora corallina]